LAYSLWKLQNVNCNSHLDLIIIVTPTNKVMCVRGCTGVSRRVVSPASSRVMPLFWNSYISI